MLIFIKIGAKKYYNVVLGFFVRSQEWGIVATHEGGV
jgi:hypothetical protein